MSTNSILKKNLSGYRIVGHKISPIISDSEIESIEEAIDSLDTISMVSEHLSKSLDCLSDRDTPDYPNSVKESISAVESLCKVITGDQNASLGKALKKIKDDIDPAMYKAFNLMYGYTSNSGGIRHGSKESDIPVRQEDAVFMLVTCSAFINYLKIKFVL